MKKNIRISEFCFEKIFQPLLEKYNWDISFSKQELVGGVRVYNIRSEEPVFNEILATIEKQLTYLNQIKEAIEK